MESLNIIHIANEESLLIFQYSNKIYRIDEQIGKEIEEAIKLGEPYLTKKLQSLNIKYPIKSDMKEPDFYPELEVILTYNCNLLCEYCWQRNADLNKTVNMDQTTFINAIDYMKKNNKSFDGTYNIGYMGGEPLLMMDFIKWSYDYLTENLSKKLNIRILTNGTLINQEMCDFFKAKDIDIIISLDGPETINYRRGNFNAIMNGLDILMKNNISIKIQSTLNINNFINGAGFEVVKFFLDKNIMHFNLMFEGPLPEFDNISLYNSYVDILKYIVEWATVHKKIPSIIKDFLLSIILPESKITQCFCRFLYPKGFQIAPNGDIFGCEFDRKRIAYGNANSKDNLQLIKTFDFICKTSKYNNKTCMNCLYVGICDGYPMLCSLYKKSFACPKQQYFKACFDTIYPKLQYFIALMKEEK